MFGSYFLDAETGNEIAANFYDTTYIPNLRVVKHTYHQGYDGYDCYSDCRRSSFRSDV